MKSNRDNILLGICFVLVISLLVPVFVMVNHQDLSSTVGRVRSSVVHIEKVGCWEGSGFAVTKDGLIVTAKHVVEGGGSFIVTMDDGKKYETDLSLYDKENDIGFLKIRPDNLDRPLIPLRLSKSIPQPGDSVFMIGSPLGKDNFNSVTLGVVSAIDRSLEEYDMERLGWTTMFQSDAQAYPGNSGCPVFNMAGRVIGVLVAGVGPGLNYSISVETFIDELDVISLKFELMRFDFDGPEEDPMMEISDAIEAWKK